MNKADFFLLMALDSVLPLLAAPRSAKLGLYYICLPMKCADELKGTTNSRKMCISSQYSGAIICKIFRVDEFQRSKPPSLFVHPSEAKLIADGGKMTEHCRKMIIFYWPISFNIFRNHQSAFFRLDNRLGSTGGAFNCVVMPAPLPSDRFFNRISSVSVLSVERRDFLHRAR